MNTYLKFQFYFIVFLSIFNCASFQPASPDSAMLIVETDISIHDDSKSNLPIQGYFKDLKIKNFHMNDYSYLVQSVQNNNYLFYQNIKPSKYFLDEGYIPVSSRGMIRFSFTAYYNEKKSKKIERLPSGAVKYFYDPNLMKKYYNEIYNDVDSGIITFMGKYKIDIYIIENKIQKIVMNFSKEKKDIIKALNFIANNYPESQWSNKAKEQLILIEDI